MPQKKLLFALAIFAFLAGCGTLRPGFETPSVSVSSFKTVPSDGMFPAFEIGLRVVNPNSYALNLDGVSYTISLEGNELIKGVANDLPVIPAYGDGEFQLTASANLLAGARLFSELMRSGNRSVAYAFEAKLNLSGLQPTIRVRDEGEISLTP